MPNNMKLQAHLQDGSLFADPLKPSATCRFKTTQSPKTIDGIRLNNYVTEIIFNDTSPVTAGEKTANDLLSVRVRVSGALESQARIKSILQSLAAQCDLWVVEDVLIGFEPTTAPINP